MVLIVLALGLGKYNLQQINSFNIGDPLNKSIKNAEQEKESLHVKTKFCDQGIFLLDLA